MYKHQVFVSSPLEWNHHGKIKFDGNLDLPSLFSSAEAVLTGLSCHS
jgi:hypothetical protein